MAAVLLVLSPSVTRANDDPPSSVPPPPPAATSASPALPAAPSLGSTTSAVIHPGDQLQIAVYPDSSLTQTVVVQHDGSIQFPLVKRVLVGGQTSAQAADTLATALSKYVKRPAVTLSVVQQGQMNVLVLGNVKNAGKFQMRSGSRLSDALAASAGVANLNGDYPMVRVLQPDGVVTMASLQKLLRDGDPTQNVELGDNAVVYVLGGEVIRVQVLGAVTRPGNVEISQGDRLSMALARAGVEAAAHPDLNHVQLNRKDPTSGKTIASYSFDMFRALKGGDDRFNPILQKDDTIFIPEARQISPVTIGVLGLFGRLLGF